MSIEFSWLLEDRITIARVYDGVKLDDLKKGNEIVTGYMQNTPYEMVHIVFDCSQVSSLSISVIQSMSELRYLRNDKMGCFLVYGMPRILNGFVSMSGAIFTQMTRVKSMRAFRDLEHTLVFLQSFDKSLPDLSSVAETYKAKVG